MKEFATVVFDPVQCRAELDALRDLLASNQELSEGKDLLPLFRKSPQLAAFLRATIWDLGPANRLAYEFQIFGDYAADIVIGNYGKGTFCAIELEDARPSSIFHKPEGKATPEWGRRFEHGFSQLVDWFFSFDDHKNTTGFTKNFGFGHIRFFGLLLIGRSKDLTAHDQTRLRWRSEKVAVNSHQVYCWTYDELYESLESDWRLFSQAASKSHPPAPSPPPDPSPPKPDTNTGS
jgi:hypothetical protein